MTKNEIITELYQSKEVEELILKIQPSDLRDDLRQYVFQILCESKDKMIITLHKEKKLRFYLVKLITNSVFAVRSGFYQIHKKPKEVHCDVFEDVVDEDNNHELIEKCEKEVSKLYWYNKELLELYAEHGTYRAVSEHTNIPVKSIHNAVKKAKIEIKSNLWK
jgi:hypothetical protein